MNTFEKLVALDARRDARLNARNLRSAAAARGDTMYVTNEPCKRGHTSPRYVSTGGCLECLTFQPAKLITKLAVTQQVISMQWVTRVGLNGDINALKCYLTECFIKYFESTGDGGVLNDEKLHRMRETGKPYDTK